MESTKILYVAQEIAPYLPESEMSSLCRNLPPAMQEKGFEIRLFMPKFGCINERRNQLHEVIRLSGQNIVIDDNDHPLVIKVASIPSARIQVYFIDNEDFFYGKNTVVAPDGTELADNDERSIFFVRGVVETVRKLRWAPNIVHCNGWITSLLPLYIKKALKADPFFAKSKVVTSLFNDSFKNPLPAKFAQKAVVPGIAKEDFGPLADKEVSYTDLIKLAIDNSDAAVQASAAAQQDVVDYAKNRCSHFLPLPDADNFAAAYNDFYKSVLQ